MSDAKPARVLPPGRMVRQGHAHDVCGRERTTSRAPAGHLVGEGSAAPVHDEHDPVAVAPGAVEVGRQREWSARGKARRVSD